MPDYLALAEELASDHSYAITDQIADSLAALDDLLAGDPARETLRNVTRRLLAPRLASLGWEPRKGESPLDTLARSRVIRALGDAASADVLREARARLESYDSLPGDLRGVVLHLSAKKADPALWDRLHELGLKTQDTAQKRLIYDALTAVESPALASRTLALALTGELPPHRAARLVHGVAGTGGHRELARDFARKNLDALLGKLTAYGANEYLAELYAAFADEAAAAELEQFTRANLPASALPATAKAADEIRFRAAFRARAAAEIRSEPATR